jgi:hypothetical protein
MKTKLILGSLLALSGMSNAQQWSGSGTTSGNIYRSGNVGIGTGMTGPAHVLDIRTSYAYDDGLRITVPSTGNGGASIYLNNENTGGHQYVIASNGTSNAQGTGNFSIYDYTNALGGGPGTRFFIRGSDGYTGIGTISPTAKLHASTSNGIAIRGDANSTGSNATGVAGNGIGSGGIGVIAGVTGRGSGGATNYGGSFLSTGSAVGVTSYGVYAEVYYPNSGGFNYGVYSTVGGNSGGSTYNPLAIAGYFDGDVVTTSTQYYTSDKRMKKDILSLNNSLEIIKKLNPVSYNFDNESNPHIVLPHEKQYGFLSQEIQEILPELTKVITHPAKLDEDGKEIAPKKEFLGLNYNGFIAILTDGIKEQQVHIESLEKQLDEQKQLINTLTQKVFGTTGINNTNTVETGFQMSQNEPNPFTHETVVKYILPTTISTAFMAVYDLSGKQITTFPINDRGSASVVLTSDKLAAGIYIYSIVADGKVVDSKRLIVAEK